MPEPELSELRRALRPRLTPYIPHSPEPPQVAFLLLDALEAFYGGSAGGGKSDALLMAALQYADVPDYSALVLRRTFPELSKPGAIMARSHEWLRGSDARWNEQRKEWRFPSGAVLGFGYCARESDVHQYLGAEYDFVGWDEATQFTEGQYRYLFSRLRRREGSPIPSRMRTASNPGGIGHAWVRRRFVDARTREPGAVFIPAKLADNPHLDQAAYVASLQHLPEALRRQLLDGDWDAFEGQAFLEFSRETHVVAGVALALAWERFESMDYGISNPTAWLAWAVDYEGNLICFDSYYQPALPSESAPIIRNRRKTWRSSTCYGDPYSLAMRTSTLRKFGEPATIQTEFYDLGLDITPGNGNPRAGYTRLRELIRPDPIRRFPDWHERRGEYGSPRLFVVGPGAPELVEQLEAAPLQPIEKRDAGEKVDPDWEGMYGHAVASARYGVMSRPDASARIPQVPDDPRAALLQKIERERDERGSSGRYEHV